MPLIESNTYKPPILLFNGHLQTIWPSLFRSVKINFTRERVDTIDGDFLDLDWAKVKGSERLAIISHGLEGDSKRQYVTGMINVLHNSGIDALAWNYRGCSGEMNLIYKLYHSGSSDDLQIVINQVFSQNKYDEIYLIGFSLGGNITLKYIGEKGESIDRRIKKGMSISVPCDLATGAQKMALPSNKIYMRRFIRQLKRKLEVKQKQFPDKINMKGYNHLTTFQQFDGRYTAPIHGFKSADDYYRQASSIFYLQNITIPTLVLNAQNDPFLSKECFPFDIAKKSGTVFLEAPTQGGHCGFPYKKGLSYAEHRAIEWLN